MLTRKRGWMMCAGLLSATAAARGLGQGFDSSWHTVDGGGAMFTTGGSLELSGTIGQPDVGAMTGGTFELVGGFWPGAAPAGTGVPAATLTAAVSRKPNIAGPGGVCDLALVPGVQSDPRQSGITELRIAFDTAPGGPGVSPVTIDQATCAAPAYVPYAGASTSSASVAGNELVLAFSPALENARSYRMTLSPSITSIAGQFVEVRALVGDVNGDGRANATDRSLVVGVWTGSTFSCMTDIDSSGRSNATDRSLVVGAWTGSQNCAP